MLSVSASISLLLTRPAPEHQPSRAELSVQRLSPRSAVLSSALLSACSSGFNECDLDPGTSFLKSSNPKPENSWICIFLAAWNTCIIQIQAAGCLWVHDGQIIFCDCSLSCSLLWLSPAVVVGGGLGCGVDMQRAPAPRPQSQCWVQPTCQAASAQPTQHNITATNYKLSVIQGALQRLGEASPYLKNDVAILLRNQYQSSVKVLKIFPLPLLGWNQVSQKLRQ